MSKIKLYKNNSLVFEKDGNINDNIFEVENIKVDLLNHILYREDASYKYTLDYKQNNANIELKEGYDIEDIQTDFKASLNEYLKGVTNELTYSKVYGLLVNHVGVEDVTSFTINDSNVNISISEDKIINISEVKLSEVV